MRISRWASWILGSSLIINTALAAPAKLGLWVADADTGAVVLEKHADDAMQPASVMKLVTTWAALETLGPDYRWKTEWLGNAPIQNHRLEGDLYWKGSGDPTFDFDALQAMQHQLMMRGIKGIQGQLVLDLQRFADVPSAEGFDEDRDRGFVVAPYAAQLGFKSFTVNALVNQGQVKMVLWPPAEGVRVDNRVRLEDNDRTCPSVSHFVRAAVGNDLVVLNGRMPKSCDGKVLYVSLLQPDVFVWQNFLAYWQLAGNTKPQGFTLGSTPADAKVLASYESAPLSQILVNMNRYSNNTIARSVYIALGLEKPNMSSQAVVEDVFRSEGLSSQGLILENGSGLSRKERLTPALLGKMLLSAYQSPLAPEFMATLPRAGKEGTLRHRFKEFGDQLRLKTGTLKNVSALAGYYRDARSHKTWVIVAILNKSESGKADRDTLDQVVLSILSRLSQGKTDLDRYNIDTLG